jgi:hypothetical protein
MRLRSSQFVFLLLLACSVQIREEHALRLVSSAISGPALSAAHLREVAAHRGPALALTIDRALQPFALPAAQVAVVSAARPMPQPAAASAAIASHTGLLRA